MLFQIGSWWYQATECPLRRWFRSPFIWFRAWPSHGSIPIKISRHSKHHRDTRICLSRSHIIRRNHKRIRHLQLWHCSTRNPNGEKTSNVHTRRGYSEMGEETASERPSHRATRTRATGTRPGIIRMGRVLIRNQSRTSLYCNWSSWPTNNVRCCFHAWRLSCWSWRSFLRRPNFSAFTGLTVVYFNLPDFKFLVKNKKNKEVILKNSALFIGLWSFFNVFCLEQELELNCFFNASGLH